MSSLTAAVLTALYAAPAGAAPVASEDNALEEVVVTASRRAVSAQDLPISITAVSGATLEMAGIQDMAGLAHSMAGVNFTDKGPFGGVNGSTLIIRGLNSEGTGGQLALACAMADKYNEKTDDLRISAAPNLIMVTSGLYDLTDVNNAWIMQYFKDKSALRDISPLYLVRKGLPPILIIHGRKDADEDYAVARHVATLIKDTGNRISFHPIDDASHLLWLDTKSLGEMEKVQQDFLRKYGY